MEIGNLLDAVAVSQEHFRYLTNNFANWYRQIGKENYAEPNIVSTARNLLKILTANNKNCYKLHAFLAICPPAQDLESSKDSFIVARLVLEQICLICIDVCSELAAADEVYIVNYNDTGKRHKLKKFANDSE